MRAYQDLREFLSVLEREQLLLRIAEQVKFEPDLAAAGCALARMVSSPAILFNNIAGCTDAQVAMNVHGSWPSPPCPRHGQGRRGAISFSSSSAASSNFPARSSASRAPWQAVVVEKDINLFELMPLFRLNRGDGASTSTRPASFRATPTTGTMTTWRTSGSTG